MIEYLTIIPARKNSKRVKRKNITLVKKKELITYTFKHAIGSNHRKNIIRGTTPRRQKKQKMNDTKKAYIKR